MVISALVYLQHVAQGPGDCVISREVVVGDPERLELEANLPLAIISEAHASIGREKIFARRAPKLGIQNDGGIGGVHDHSIIVAIENFFKK